MTSFRTTGSVQWQIGAPCSEVLCNCCLKFFFKSNFVFKNVFCKLLWTLEPAPEAWSLDLHDISHPAMSRTPVPGNLLSTLQAPQALLGMLSAWARLFSEQDLGCRCRERAGVGCARLKTSRDRAISPQAASTRACLWVASLSLHLGWGSHSPTHLQLKYHIAQCRGLRSLKVTCLPWTQEPKWTSPECSPSSV